MTAQGHLLPFLGYSSGGRYRGQDGPNQLESGSTGYKLGRTLN
jgi:hypothetical protein